MKSTYGIMKISDNKLIAECTTYDFKVKLKERKVRDWLKSVSAFANTKGGALYYGVDDSGAIVGLEEPQRIAEVISQNIKDLLEPVPEFSLTPDTTDDGKVILELKVFEGRQTPYYLFLDGHPYGIHKIGE